MNNDTTYNDKITLYSIPFYSIEIPSFNELKKVNNVTLPVWEMIETSLGIKLGLKFYALRLRGILMLEINVQIHRLYGFYVRGPVAIVNFPHIHDASLKIAYDEKTSTVTTPLIIRKPIPKRRMYTFDDDIPYTF